MNPYLRWIVISLMENRMFLETASICTVPGMCLAG